jgi:hypothetical protein
VALKGANYRKEAFLKYMGIYQLSRLPYFTPSEVPSYRGTQDDCSCGTVQYTYVRLTVYGNDEMNTGTGKNQRIGKLATV